MGYPAKYRMIARQGSTLKKLFTWTIGGEPVDLTDSVAKMQVRERASSPDVILDAGEYIQLGADGTIDINVPASVTAELDAGRYVYDLELHIGEEDVEVTTVMAGEFIVNAEVTRD